MTLTEYTVTAQGFDLATCFQEENRLCREIEKLERMPNGAGQVAIREEFLKILDRRCEALYAQHASRQG